jgi:hypothetical protein
MPVELDQRERVRDLLKGYGRTRGQDAGIRMADQPPPPYQLLIGTYHGHRRQLRDKAGGDVVEIAGLLEEFPGIGPAGASVFLREVQETWLPVRPSVDERLSEGARHAGLPSGHNERTTLMSGGQQARLAAAFVRVSLTRHTSTVQQAKHE